MLLSTRTWGEPASDAVVCVHGLVQHGGIFAPLGRSLSADGRFVVAVDLRGHGESGRQPPWNVETHVDDLLETLEQKGVERFDWVGHSFGGRVVAEAAARAEERSRRLALLDPGLEVPIERAIRGAEIDRLDWSFATVDGARTVRSPLRAPSTCGRWSPSSFAPTSARGRTAASGSATAPQPPWSPGAR